MGRVFGTQPIALALIGLCPRKYVAPAKSAEGSPGRTRLEVGGYVRRRLNGGIGMNIGIVTITKVQGRRQAEH